MLFGKKKEIDAKDDKITVNASTITTFIGVDSVFEGALSTKASLRIDGTVIGDIKTEGVVILTKTGKVTGTIEAENIIIAGTVTGNMSIRDKVNVESTGQIYGEVITGKFVIDEESIFQGNCIMNRDGKKIPVTPYNPNAGKEEKDTEEKSDNTKSNSNEKRESRSRKKNRRTNKATVKKTTEPTTQENTKEDIKAAEEKIEDKINANPQEELDSEIEISDIDDLKNEEKKTDIKKPKSLNVEIEE